MVSSGAATPRARGRGVRRPELPAWHHWLVAGWPRVRSARCPADLRTLMPGAGLLGHRRVPDHRHHPGNRPSHRLSQLHALLWLASVLLQPFGEPALRANLLVARCWSPGAAALVAIAVVQVTRRPLIGLSRARCSRSRPSRGRTRSAPIPTAFHLFLAALLLVLLLGWAIRERAGHGAARVAGSLRAAIVLRGLAGQPRADAAAGAGRRAVRAGRRRSAHPVATWRLVLACAVAVAVTTVADLRVHAHPLLDGPATRLRPPRRLGPDGRGRPGGRRLPVPGPGRAVHGHLPRTCPSLPDAIAHGLGRAGQHLGLGCTRSPSWASWWASCRTPRLMLLTRPLVRAAGLVPAGLRERGHRALLPGAHPRRGGLGSARHRCPVGSGGRGLAAGASRSTARPGRALVDRPDGRSPRAVLLLAVLSC